jgi:ferric-dicitrate binding protein FerR (iron transport regulator)
VISNGVTTTALGTSFNVNCKNNNYVEISLVSGMVKVTNTSMKSVILNPGKSAIVSENGKLHIQDFDRMDKVGWKNGVLVFNNNSLPDTFI